MSGLLGPNGKPISSATYGNKKAPAPATGEKYGTWGGPNTSIMGLPGGGAIQFDLNQLGLADFREMRDDYQINSSLSVLTFLMHQIEWRIECEDKKAAEFYTEQLENIWTPLVRSKAQAFWAGHSPNVLQWENDVPNRRINLGKVKDLIPEDAAVNWKTVDGAGTHKIAIYDGIKQFGGPKIPVENSYWYPLLMENGDYSGRKLLRPAFQPWFFSILIHLFANRYFERFGEPTPIGRAPYDDEIRYGGKDMRGNEAMELLLGQLRNRSVVVLPSDKTPAGDETDPDYDYQIEYLESAMRGADFERYMSRLDEEKSLALFTPILLTRSSDVGSYAMADVQKQTYQSMLNALSGDWKYYLDWYILKSMRDYNFGYNAPLPKIKFRRMGAQNEEIIRDVIRTMLARQTMEPANIEQLGEVAGIDLKIIRQLTDDNAQPEDPSQPTQAGSSGDGEGSTDTENVRSVYPVVAAMRARVGEQVHNAWRKNKMRDTEFDLGFQARFDAALRRDEVPEATAKTKKFYDVTLNMLNDLAHMQWGSADEMMSTFGNQVNYLLKTTLES